MLDFSGSAGAASSFDTLPKGLLVFAILQVKGLKGTQAGGQYLDIELTVDAGQPHAGRKIFDMIGDPQNAGNSEKYREMGTIAITRILEAGRGAGPNNMAGYQIPNYEALSGLRVAIKVGVEEGTGGHNDKNRVAEWLTPNPASQSGNKGWVKLVAGDHGLAAAPAAQQSGFGGFGASAGNANGAAAQTGAFGNGGGAPAASSGFGQPQGGGFAQPAASGASTPAGFATTPPATSPSPSNPGATPGWLAQASAA